MYRTINLWIEIIPDGWYSWDDVPFRLKAGKIRRTPPPEDQRHLFTQVRLVVDAQARYGKKELHL